MNKEMRNKIGKYMDDWLWKFIPDKGDNWIIAEGELWSILGQPINSIKAKCARKQLVAFPKVRAEIIKQAKEECNKFILECAEAVGIDTDVIGFDEIKITPDDFSNAIKQAKDEDKWILVEDKLPEEHQDILIYYDPHSNSFPNVRYMTQSSYYNNRFEVLREYHEVLYWQPLPKPPSN